MRKGIRWGAFLLGLMMLLLPLGAWGEETPAPEAEAVPEAQHVSRQCGFKSDMPGFYLKYLRDGELDSFNYISAAHPLHVEPRDSGAAYLCIAWERRETPRILRFYGGEDALLLEVKEPSPYYNETVPLPEGTAWIEILTEGEEKISAAEVLLYTEGALPEPWNYTWEPTPEKLDFLIIGTHFDDEALYLGAVMPIYGGEQGYTGTFLHMTYQLRMRLEESLQGDWTMGARYYPLFAMLPDVYKETGKHAPEYSEEIVTQTLVRYYRRYKPLVIFTQDTEGEYGHWQHCQTVKCALAAIPLAADSSYDTESAEQYGVWQVQKAYVHVYPERKITLDTRTPLEAFGGLTALEVAQAAYKKHVSQITAHAYEVRDDYKYSIADFGLAFSAVENPGEGVFDGIDETLFAGYVPPTPAPTEEPTATPRPTDEPTAEPTPASVSAAPEEGEKAETTSSTDAEEPEKDASATPAVSGFGLLAGILLLCGLLGSKKGKPASSAKKKKKAEEDEEMEEIEMILDMEEDGEEDD